ncbi:MAG: ABC transporter ATP-binding protein, partial [Treponema sp.]|nr:ABC transporter ATP-binding protein [Treponema sp.]
MKTKKKTDERKYHKEYGLWSNTRFVLSSAWKYDKKIYLLTFLSIIIAPLSKYLWTILSKIVIDIATRERFYSKNILILGASVFTVVLILIGVIEIFTGNDRWWRETYVRIRLMSIKNSVSMKIDFAHLEDTDVLDCYQKAGNACSGDTNGVEGLLKSVLDFAVELSGMFAGLAIMATLNGWIVVAILFLTVIQGIFSNRINKNAKATVWDVLAPWWRKRAYMDRMSNDFSAAKDIRMFSLKEWILDKYRELNKERLAAQKRNELLWFYNGIFSTFTWILSQIVVYAWLLKSVVNGQMTAGNFSLYLGSSGVFFASASQVTGAITRLLARSREVDDFRSFIDFANTTGGACASGGNPVPKYDKYEFVFENVSFKYPGAEKYALKNLNITVKGGERLAVV